MFFFKPLQWEKPIFINMMLILTSLVVPPPPLFEQVVQSDAYLKRMRWGDVVLRPSCCFSKALVNRYATSKHTERVGFKTLNTVREMVMETQPMRGTCSEYQLVQSSVYSRISFPISVCGFPEPGFSVLFFGGLLLWLRSWLKRVLECRPPPQTEAFILSVEAPSPPRRRWSIFQLSSSTMTL